MPISVRVHQSLAEIPREAWAALSAGLDTPVLEWEWLDLLETAGGLDGWAPCHLALWRGRELLAAAPLYLRSHSWGDFVYDFAFAEAAERYGRRWYPKLLGMVPATPSPGWRVLTLPGEDAAELERRWWEEACALGKQLGTVSLQANFVEPESVGLAGGAAGQADDLGGGAAPFLPTGFRYWSHQHFLWTNRGFRDFGDYLGSFDKNQRRNIRRERASLADAGITTRIVSGEEIPDEWFGLMGRLYDRTNEQFGPWAARFLAPGFFDQLHRIRGLLHFAASFREGEPLPLALGFLLGKNGRLVGRYWGEREHLPDQYFNVCYYRPIEEIIARGWRDFDPGAGSPLKARRGFESKRNLSLHRFFDPFAERLFRDNIDHINREEEERITQLNQAVPFRQGGPLSENPSHPPVDNPSRGV